MAKDKDPRDARTQAEARFEKAQKTTDEAKTLADTDLQAVRKKTERLRKLRLTKEEAERMTELDKKPAAKRKKATRRTWSVRSRFLFTLLNRLATQQRAAARAPRPNAVHSWNE